MVHAKALEIRWHDQMPIFSADFHSTPPDKHKRFIHPYAKGEEEEEDKVWRLATAGGDKLVRIWLVHPRPPTPQAPKTLVPSTSKLPPPTGGVVDLGPRVEYLATLKQHTGVVNVVRFSPVGETLASAGDDGNVLFWVPGESTSGNFGENHEDKVYEKESWRVKSMVRSKSGQEIYDLTWNPSGTYVLVGSVDHTANIYDVSSGQLLHTIAEHTNYVQGVAWDPHNHFIATQSSDRSMHVYSLSQNASTGGFQIHAVGKNSRMDIQHHPSSSNWKSPSSSQLIPPPPLTIETDPLKEKGKEVEPQQQLSRPTATLHRSISQRSDSDRSDISSITRFSLNEGVVPSPSPSTTIAPSFEEPTSMDPPLHPRPSSRRSSTSGSISGMGGHSPALLPSFRHARSPSPAPLPAVRVPSSPKLGPTSLPSNSKIDNLKLYGDANSTPFFRRLCWSTDGSLLLTPAGLFEDPYASIEEKLANSISNSSSGNKKKKEKEKEVKNTLTNSLITPKPTVYIYSRSNVSRPPIAHLPGHKTTSIAIRFCPILWELRHLRSTTSDGLETGTEDDCLKIPLNHQGVTVDLPGVEGGGEEEKKESLFDLPYRMVYAVATLDAVFLYDTQQAGPICMFGNLHYAPFTDLTWSADGQTLVVASQDGYCSVIAFDPLELGRPYKSALAPVPIPDHLGLPSPPTTTPSTLQPLFAATPPPPASTTAAKLTTSAVVSGSGAVVPEKRMKEVEGDQALPVKKKKKAELTFVGPLGGGSS